MNTIQKLVTIGEDNTLIWYQKGEWVSDLGNVVTIDPDRGIYINGVPVDGGGGGAIPPILTPDKVFIENGGKTVTITAQDGFVVNGVGATTVNDGGVKISNGGTLAIGGATLGAPLLSMLQATNNTTTGNIVLDATKSLVIGGQTLTRNKLISLTTDIPSQIGVLDTKVLDLEGEVTTLTPLKGRVTALEVKDVAHESRLSALEAADGAIDLRVSTVETGLTAEMASLVALTGKVDDNEAMASAGITTLNGKIVDLEDKVQLNTGRITAVGGVAGDAVAAAAAANTAAVSAQGTADTALATANLAQGTADASKVAADAAEANALTALTGATGAQTTADRAEGKAEAAQITADLALTGATGAQTAADRAEGKADSAQTTADRAEGKADSAQTTADSAEGKATAAQTTADAAKITADASKIAADAAEGNALTALAAATMAQNTADAASDDIVTLKSTDVAFDGRITALENGSGGEPVVLPFYAKTTGIDFGEGNVTIGNNTITAGTGSKILLGATQAVSLESTGALKLGPTGTLAVGNTTLNSTGGLNLGFGGEVNIGTSGVVIGGDNSSMVLGTGGTLRLGSATLSENGIATCNQLASIAEVEPTNSDRMMLYTPSGFGYGNLPLSFFQNPEWVTPSGPTFPDPTLGETNLRKSILTLDGAALTQQGIKAAQDLSNDIRTAFLPGMVFATRDETTGQIRTTTLPTYITDTGVTFGSNTIGPEQTETLVDITALTSESTNTNYVSYNPTTHKFGYQAKPTFIDTVNNVVGNMGGTTGATEAYLTRNGVTFGSATTFEPLENTCYGSTALTVVDRTQGTVGQRKRAEFGANGIVLSNPLATSLDDPETITLNRERLALLQRIASIDVIASPDVAPTSTKRMLVGDKVTGAYSYATAPVLPDYIKPSSLVMGTDAGDISVNKTNITATTGSGIVTTLTAAGITSVLGNKATNVGPTNINVSIGMYAIDINPTFITFRDSASETNLTKDNVEYLKNNFINAANAGAITDVDADGAIRFLAGPATGTAPKKFLLVPKSYSWLKDTNITASVTENGITRSNVFDKNGIVISNKNSISSSSDTSATITPSFIRMDNNTYSMYYGPTGISSTISSQIDPVYGSGVVSLEHRGMGAAAALGVDAFTPYNDVGVNYLTVAKNEGTKVQYKYLKVSDVIPSFNGAVIEPKRNPTAIISPNAGAGARAAVLDAAGLSFPANGALLPVDAANAPHDDTTYNSKFMRIGNAESRRTTITERDIKIVDGVTNVIIDKDRLSFERSYIRTDVYHGSISFSSNSAPTEYLGYSNFDEAKARMVSSIYDGLYTITSGKYNMIVNSNGTTKTFSYQKYISHGTYHRFPLRLPNGAPESKNAINAFTTGNTSLGIHKVSGELRAKFVTFAGEIKTIPFASFSRLFLDFDFIDSDEGFSSETNRYVFLSPEFLVTDTVEFVRYHPHATEGVGHSFNVTIKLCTISQSHTINNFSIPVLEIENSSADDVRGIVEITITRPSLYDPIVPESVISTR